MKIASYNIMSGGFSNYDHERTHPQRLQEIRTAIRELDADIVGLIDTFRWNGIFSIKQLCNLFGYDYVRCINLNDERLRVTGDDNGITLMSRLPWQHCEIIRLDTRDALKASFEIDGKEMIVILAYLDDLQEDVRLRQAQAMLGPIDRVDNVLIMGDLNTIALNDRPNVSCELEAFYTDNPGIEERLGPVIDQMKRAEVIAWFESQGFIDQGREAGATVPSRLFPAASRRPFLRLDYCLHGSGLKVDDFAVHTTEIMQRASDHLPISFSVK